MGAFLNWLYNSLGSLLAFFYGVVPSYAFAIAMLTISVRVVLIPLTAKQVKSQRAMQQLSPELKKLQAKHKGDRQKLNEEMMKLYKEHKANPLAGCLPLILQLPVFIVLYRLVTDLSDIPPNHIPIGSELFAAIVAAEGQLQSIGMDLAQRPQSLTGLFLVAGIVASGFFQQRQMTSRMSKDSVNPQMQMIMKVFPIFFAVISLSVPAGVGVYFLISNLWQMGQQEVAFRHMPIKTESSGDDDGDGDAGDGSKGKDGSAGRKVIEANGSPTKSGSSSTKSGQGKGGTQGKAKGQSGKGQSGKGQSGKGGTSSAPGGRASPKGGAKSGGRVTPPKSSSAGGGRTTPKGGPATGGRGKAGGSERTSPRSGRERSGRERSGRDGSGERVEPEGPLTRLSALFSPKGGKPDPKSDRPPPTARPKGLPPTEPSDGSSKKGS